MHLRGLDLNLLVVLDVLLDERNVTRASERLRLSQSGTSTALARLREFFGDQLLVPIGRKMVLTPLSQTLVGPVREILLQAHTLIDATPGFNPETATRRFTIMASDYVATVFLPPVVERLSKEAPGVVIEIVPQGEITPSEPLERGDVDFLILPEKYIAGEHPAERLFEDVYVCISWAGNADFTGNPDLETYFSMGHVVTRFGAVQGMAFDEWFLERFDRPRRVETVAMNFALVPHLIVGTQRLATTHRRLAEQYANYLPIRVHPLPFDLPATVEMLQWNRFSDRHPATIWLRGVLTQSAEALSIDGKPASSD
jgi:LysR family nod box-dependent transcriptional activator